MIVCDIDFRLNVTLQGKEGHRDSFYLFHGYDSRKIRFCHILLRLMDICWWVPAQFAAIPLWLCEEQTVESLLGCDPDVIRVSGLRWGRQLQKLLRRRYPQWTCATRRDEGLNANLKWRKFNPSSKVSIILPTYNGSKYICKSIESCLNQTFKNLELIIVDDGSTQDILEVINVYRDSRIKYFRHNDNRGLSEALNTGFRNSTGEYLTWTSDDNYYGENAIEEMIRFLQTYPEVDFIYADSYMIDENRKDQRLRILRNHPVERLRIDNHVGACFLYRRQVYEAIGEYNRHLPLVEDYDYWVRVSKQFRMQRLFRPLYYYRFHPDSLTSKHSRKEVLEKIKLVQQLNNIRCQ